MQTKKLTALAQSWRSHQFGSDHTDGVVLIYNGAVYGWKDKLRNPECERPGAFAVTQDGKTYRATGGDDYNGAEHWELVA